MGEANIAEPVQLSRTSTDILPDPVYTNHPEGLVFQPYHRPARSESIGRGSYFLANINGKEIIFSIEKVDDYPAAFGGASEIRNGIMMRKDGDEDVYIEVALKYQRFTSVRDWPGQDVENEVRCWKLLNHKHVAPLYGVYVSSDGIPAIVMPWYRNGSANEYLSKHSDANPLKIIQELASAVEHLHRMGVIHGDIKGSNIMIDDYGHVKLIDYGASRRDTDVAPINTVYSLRWCPTELLTTQYSTTTASDVYSFASTALELLTGCVPYDTLIERLVPLKILNGVRPRGFSSNSRYDIPCSDELWHLLEKCWADSPLRPSMTEVRLYLERLSF